MKLKLEANVHKTAARIVCRTYADTLLRLSSTSHAAACLGCLAALKEGAAENTNLSVLLKRKMHYQAY
eukprot:m.423638 g.423638  ORF g.423638 m.423638 type:complete len:68 (+) comp20211_c4_seq28:512-715(+)